MVNNSTNTDTSGQRIVHIDDEPTDVPADFAESIAKAKANRERLAKERKAHNEAVVQSFELRKKRKPK